MQLPLPADVLVPLGIGVIVAVVAVAAFVIGLRRRADESPAPTHADWTGENVGVDATPAPRRRQATAVRRTVADAIAARRADTDPFPVVQVAHMDRGGSDADPFDRSATAVVTPGTAQAPLAPATTPAPDGSSEQPVAPDETAAATPAGDVPSATAEPACASLGPLAAATKPVSDGAGRPVAPDQSVAATPPGGGRFAAAEPAPAASTPVGDSTTGSGAADATQAPADAPRPAGARDRAAPPAPQAPAIASAAGAAPAPQAQATASWPSGAPGRAPRPTPQGPVVAPAVGAASMWGSAAAEPTGPAPAPAAAHGSVGAPSPAHPGVPAPQATGGPGQAGSAAEGPVDPEGHARHAAADPGSAGPEDDPTVSAPAAQSRLDRPSATSPDPADPEAGTAIPHESSMAAGSSRDVGTAVAHVLAARAAAPPPGGDRRGGDARDRLLAVLLDDPTRAVGAAVDLQDCQERMDRLAGALNEERGRLRDVLGRLARSGLRADQLARLSGLSDSDVAELLRRNIH